MNRNSVNEAMLLETIESNIKSLKLALFTEDNAKSSEPLSQPKSNSGKESLSAELDVVIRGLKKACDSFFDLSEAVGDIINQLLREDLNKLKEHYGTYSRISQVTGVSPASLHRIAHGESRHVTKEVFKSIEDCVKKKEEWNVKTQ